MYAGRVVTRIDYAELERLWRRLQPLAMSTMPLDAPPPRTSRFGAPLGLEPHPLGAAKACRRGQIPDLD